MDHKKCTKCNRTLPITEYHLKMRRRKSGSTYKSYNARCKTCRNKEVKVWRRDNVSHRRDYNQLPQRKAEKRERKRLKDIRKSHNAVPNWLTAKHKKEIRAIYLHAADCRVTTGEEYHVDHIIPLKGDVVCGLHVPWNLQVLPADVNISKSNKWEWGSMDQ